MQKKNWLTAALLIIAAGAATAADAKSADPAVQKAISQASAAIKKADSVGFAWRDSVKMLKEAEAAAQKGDNERAMALANKARKQGESAYQQYLDQRNAGPRF